MAKFKEEKYLEWFKKEGENAGFTEKQTIFLYDMICATEDGVKEALVKLTTN